MDHFGNYRTPKPEGKLNAHLSMIIIGESEDLQAVIEHFNGKNRVVTAILGHSKDPNFSWIVSLKEFAYPAIDNFSTVGTIGPNFFLAIAMFGFLFQISSLITEKELKLRQAMTMMGLYDTAYWLSWLSWEGIIAIFSSLFTVLFGMMFQFYFFLNNNFVVLFLLFFLFQLNMIGFAFMLSTFISKSSSSTTVGFSVFIIGFLTQLVTAFGFPYIDNFWSTYRSIWSLFPPNLLSEALQLLADATSTPEDLGISWSKRTKCASNDTECVITIVRRIMEGNRRMGMV